MNRLLRTQLSGALRRLADSEEELRELDGIQGDGDLGITIRRGSEAAIETLAAMPDAPPCELLRSLAQAVATANPSTFAALVAGGLLAGAKELDGAVEIGREEAIALGGAVSGAIAQRGGSGLGDRTVLDAIIPSVAAAQGSPAEADALRDALDAARMGAEVTRDLVPQRGRAAWVGERALGHPDAGAIAYVRFLEALEAERASEVL